MHTTAMLIDPEQAKLRLAALWRQAKPELADGRRLEIEIRPERRSTSQNARMWAMLTEVSNQVIWHGQKLTPAEWKTMFTAALKKQRVLPGLEGGFVVIGDSTSRMTVRELAELMELIEAFGIERGVQFTADQEAA